MEKCATKINALLLVFGLNEVCRPARSMTSSSSRHHWHVQSRKLTPIRKTFRKKGSTLHSEGLRSAKLRVIANHPIASIIHLYLFFGSYSSQEIINKAFPSHQFFSHIFFSIGSIISSTERDYYVCCFWHHEEHLFCFAQHHCCPQGGQVHPQNPSWSSSPSHHQWDPLPSWGVECSSAGCCCHWASVPGSKVEAHKARVHG